MLKRTVYEAALIIFSAAVISLMVNALRPRGIDLFDRFQETSATDPAGFSIIDFKAAVNKYRKGQTLFVDARSADIFASGHIKNAVNLPDHEFEAWIEEFMSKTAPEKPIVTYCDGVECSQARDLAEKLGGMGFRNVFYFPEGYEVWVRQGLEIQSDLDRAINR